MDSDVQVFPVYAEVFFGRIIQIDQPEPEIIYFHSPGIENIPRLLFDSIFGGVLRFEDPADVRASLVCDQHERGIADGGFPYVQTLFLEKPFQ